MANELNKESSLFPSSDGDRENSGLQDILAVAAKIKDQADEPPPREMTSEDSGLIMFSAGTGDEVTSNDADDALFAGFSGGLGSGLGAGFGAAADPLGSADVTPLAAEASVAAATPSVAEAKPADAKRSNNPLVAVAVVLGLVLAGGALVVLTDKGEQPAPEQAQAGMSAQAEGDAAVGKAEEPSADAVDPAAGAAVQPELLPANDTEGQLAGDTEGLLAGDTEGAGLLADADDPMAQRDGLLENDGTNGAAKAGNWDQGKSYAKANPTPVADPDPDPDPIFDPKPAPEPDPIKPASNGGGGGDDVDCLLNPDLPKCQTGSAPKPKKEEEVLAPKLPEKLSSSQLRKGMNKVKTAAKKCGLQNGVPPGTKVKVHVSIEGPTGKVSAVKALGAHAGSPVGSCVEAAVKNASFEQFKKPAMGIEYSMIM